jgi:cytochrome c-type biogenesis protein CcmH
MLWVAFAVMTGAAVMAVLWPLGRRRAGQDGVAVDKAFYETELGNIARDLDLGLITEAEAAGARTEAARRLLASVPEVAAKPAESRRPARIAAIAALILVPAVTLALYMGLGSPDYPDQPLATRLTAPPGQMDVEIALARIEKHLAEVPDDVRGWQVIAPVYMKLGRTKEGADAYRNLIRLQGPRPDLLATYGEALIFAANGQVTSEAREILERAVASDPDLAQARFYLAMGEEQAGHRDAAIAAYTSLVTEQPQAPWAPMVRERIANLGGTPPAAPAAKAEGSKAAGAVAALPPDEQAAAIRAMVERLATRLSSEGGTVENWSQLIRAYSVLNEADKAREALANGRKALGGDAAAVAKLDDLARELGLGG